jgi:2-polyprenyl-6-methoxyphenol hydroxylase-like FAD-dependent oxidoreductase
VAREVGAAAYRVGQHAAAVVYGYWAGLDADGYEWRFGRAAATGRIPTSDGATCVFAACPTARFIGEIRRDLGVGYFRLLNEVSPALMQAVASAQPLGRLRGFPGVAGWMRQSHGPGWALVGDAGYFKDPITAHGITDAFRDAELLARAVLAGSPRALADYQAERDDLSHGLFDVTDAIASFSWDFPRLQALHRTMSREVNRESSNLAALGPLPAPAAAPEMAAACP